MRYDVLFAAVMSLLMLAAPCAAAADIAASADSAYNAGAYEEAVALYEDVLASEGLSPEILFNLGNAAYEAGDYGKAVLAYERAHRLDPGDAAINGNLRFVLTKVTDANRGELKGKKGRVEPDNPTFFRTIRRWVAYDHTSDSWAVLAAMAFVLLVAMVALYVFSPSVALKKVGFFSAIVLLVFSGTFLSFAFMAASEARRTDRAVVTAYKMALRKSPEEESETLSAPLNRGTSVEIVEEKVAPGATAVWCLVRLNSDNVGWVRKSDLEVI